MQEVRLDGSAEVCPANRELGPPVGVFGLVALDVHNGDAILFNPTMKKEKDDQIFRGLPADYPRITRGLPADYPQNKNCNI